MMINLQFISAEGRGMILPEKKLLEIHQTVEARNLKRKEEKN